MLQGLAPVEDGLARIVAEVGACVRAGGTSKSAGGASTQTAGACLLGADCRSVPAGRATRLQAGCCA